MKVGLNEIKVDHFVNTIGIWSSWQLRCFSSDLRKHYLGAHTRTQVPPTSVYYFPVGRMCLSRMKQADCIRSLSFSWM